MLVLAHFLCLIRSRTPVHGMAPPTSRFGLPIPIKLISVHSQTCPKVCLLGDSRPWLTITVTVTVTLWPCEHRKKCTIANSSVCPCDNLFALLWNRTLVFLSRHCWHSENMNLAHCPGLNHPSLISESEMWDPAKAHEGATAAQAAVL